jgi:chaperonin GroES
MRPLEDRVLVRLDDPEEQTDFGLVIPAQAQRRPEEGEVLAVGPGRWEHGQRAPVDLSVGDRVLVSRYGGTEIELEGETFHLFQAHDVLARFDYVRSAEGGVSGISSIT